MSAFRSALLTAGAGLAAVSLTVLATASPAAAAPAGSLGVTTSPVAAAAGWLTTQFAGADHLPTPGGDHFDSKYGSSYYPNYGENADVVFGLAAARSGGAKIATAMSYLAANADAYADLSGTQGGPYDGSVAKLATAAIVAGQDPKDFAGHDLMTTLKKDECTAASATCAAAGAASNIYASISESFVVLAEARVGGTFAPSTAALNYLLSLQCSSGGFTSDVTACKAGDEDVDATSYAIMALTAAGGHATELKLAATWLESQRTSGGYWDTQKIPNTNSTGLAAAALQGTGADVSTSQAWLRSQQVPRGQAGAGALRYAGTVVPTTTSATSPSVLATAQGLVGLVDGGGLATLTAAGTTSGADVFAPTASLASDPVRPRATVRVGAHGFAAGETVRVSVHSTPVTVATTEADALGSLTASFTLPASVTAGAHTVELTGVTSGLVTDTPLTVVATTSPASGSGGPSTGSTTSGSTSGGSTTGTTTGSASAPLAATGSDTLGLTLVGALAAVAGLGLTILGRARRRA